MSQCKECGNTRIVGQSLCHLHYHRAKRAGKLKVIQPHIVQNVKCIVVGCNNKPDAKNLCIKHYARKLKRGFLVKRINTEKWTSENIAWLAGLIEGEGCFSIRKYKNKQYVSTRVIMTDFDIIEKIYKIVNHGVVSGPYCRNVPNRKPWKNWVLNDAAPQLELLKRLLPWLGNRRKKKVLECIKILNECIKSTRNLYA